MMGKLISALTEEASMPKAVFQAIYRALHDEVEAGRYPYQSFLPSEAELCERFGCSRSSVRRALAVLTTEGLVQPLQGKGVRVIRNAEAEGMRGLTGLETFAEMAERRGFIPRTEVVALNEVVCDGVLATASGFSVGSVLTQVTRVRFADDEAVGTDESYYLASSVAGLTPEIAARGVYRYLERELGMKIVTVKRRITVEPVNASDKRYIDLNGSNAIAVVRGRAFDTDGIMIEYTETRQRSGFFELDETSIRTPIQTN